MCGIAGYKVNKRVDGRVLKNMVDALHHRGPDADGFYSSGPYQAGMRRLSINDLQTGNQPLFNRDKSVVLFYNGEIYNSPELRQELEAKGYVFRTHSDGEVICHLYDEMGEALFERLDGMFVTALWIEKKKQLILARDIPGEKPLYYARLGNNEIAFASEIKSLVRFPGIDLGLNYQGLWDFPTFLWIPEPDTVYEKIKALPRSHLLICDDSGIRLSPYENRFGPHSLGSSDREIVDETRRVVSESVKSRLLSDVPMGCFLSSGLDSSIVATLAVKSLPTLDTFTIGFEDVDDHYHGKADESRYAEAYAAELGTRHHTIHVKADDFNEILLEFCSSLDQPFSVSSALGIRAVAKAAHERGVKVLLSGDCADECFGGYSWYFHLNNPSTQKPRLDGVHHITSFNNFGISTEERVLILNTYTPQQRAWAWHYYAAESEKWALYNPEVFQGCQASLRFFEQFKPGDDWTPEDFIRQDRNFYLPNEMLQKLDRMTMAFSVEGRVPFAAPAILKHSDQLKYHHMVRNGSLKWALREAFKDILPKDTYARPKHGFNVPVDHWFRNGWATLLEESFSSSSGLAKAGLITPKSSSVANKMAHDKIRLNGHTLFSFVVLNQWLEACFGGNHR